MMPIFAEMSAEGWVLIIGAITLGALKLLSMYLEHMADERQQIRDEAAAAKAEEVKKLAAKSIKATVALATATHEKLDDVARTGEIAHTLANNAMLAEKEGRAEADERLAKVTGKEEDIARAKASRKAADTHREEQAKLTEEIKAAADKRAAAKVKSLDTALTSVEENIEKIEGHTGKMADAAVKDADKPK